MQTEIKFNFDLGTAAGRAEFQRLFGHLLPPATVVPETGVVDVAVEVERTEPAPRRFGDGGTSIPTDPDRAAAALAGRQAAAAKARAAKAAKVDAGNGPIEKVLGPVDTGADLNGQEDPRAEEDLGLVDPNMSPAEAKEAGLAIVREAYAAGKVAQVKALQKAWQIAKFYDIPNERGHEFFAQVMKLAHETGLRK